MRLLLAPFLVAAWLWSWAAPAIPDPGLRYVTLFILPQVALNHAAGFVLPLLGAAPGNIGGCLLALCCCFCLPVILLVGSDPKSEWDLIPEFGPREVPPQR